MKYTSYKFDLSLDSMLGRAMRRVQKYAPFAYMKLLALTWEALWDTPYGATDGRKLFLNPDGLKKISLTSDPVGYAAFLLLHEALHALLSHAVRLRGLKDMQLANIAADYIINAMIASINRKARAAGAKCDPFPMIEGVLLDEELSADHHVIKLYNILAAQQGEEQTGGDTGDTGDTVDSGEDSGDTGEDTGEDAPRGWDKAETSVEDDTDDTEGDTGGDPSLEDLLNEDDSTGDTEGDTGDTEGDTGDTAGDTGDTEGDTGDTDRKSGDEAILDDFVGTSTGSDLQEPTLNEGETVEEFEQAVEESNEQITLQEQLAQSSGLQDQDSGYRQLVEHRKQWKGLDWKGYVAEWMSKRVAEGWDKPLNVSTFSTLGLVEDDRQSRNAGELMVVVDTSCSVPSSIVREMLDAVQDALDTLQPEAIHLISSDHKVQEYQRLETGDTVPPSLKGGGGTLFKQVFEFVDKQGLDIDGLIFLSDGDAADWSDVQEPTYPVLWLHYENYKDPSTYPFGQVVEVSRS